MAIISITKQKKINKKKKINKLAVIGESHTARTVCCRPALYRAMTKYKLSAGFFHPSFFFQISDTPLIAGCLLQ